MDNSKTQHETRNVLSCHYSNLWQHMNKNIPTYLPTSLKISTKREHTHRSLLGSLLENTKIPASTQNKALPLITQKIAQKQSMIYIKNKKKNLEKPTTQIFCEKSKHRQPSTKNTKKWIQNKPLLDLVGKHTLFLQNKASVDLAVK